ncbi:MAG: hypothetical protein K2Z25_15365 [Beijerinckiaceae bacterium]|nr:hypothetical protein [Beijerinckiaceae bacterium]
MARDPRAEHMHRRMRALGFRPASTEPAQAPAAPAKAMAALPASLDPVAVANARAAEMSSISAYAAKHGVSFDLRTALASGMSPRQARKQVMDAAAAADEALPTFVMPSRVSAAAASADEMWDRAMARAAKRAGLAMPGSGR